LRDGDKMTIDAVAGTIDVALSDAERRAPPRLDAAPPQL
jgi:dihydroxyacid dehydratase/phosphogluconate dehydratase